MKIGLTRRHQTEHFDSVRTFFWHFEHVLRLEGHDLIFLPAVFFDEREESQHLLAKEFVANCDVIVYAAQAEGLSILKARSDSLSNFGKHVPLLYLTLGSAPRGGRQFARTYKYILHTDILLTNSTSEADATRLLLPDANVALAPFPVDKDFFARISERQKTQLRHHLGLHDHDRVILYSGRLTIEKNLHSLLRLFATVRNVVPTSVLLIAGEASDIPFQEFGVYTRNWYSTLTKLRDKLGLTDKNVRFLGHVDKAQLISLYGIADVVLNLTLHHDENFGLAQAEAMAAGVPVVGSCWGGLRDVIQHEATGYHVDVYCTPTGVRLDWWQALNSVVTLLRSSDLREEFSRAARECCFARFGPAAFAASLQGCLHSLSFVPEPSSISPSLFAIELWMRMKARKTSSSIKPHTREFRLYQRLMNTFAGVTADPEKSDTNAEPWLLLPMPVQRVTGVDGQWLVDDPMYPLTITVPPEFLSPVSDIMELMLECPVVSESQLVGSIPKSALGALAWLINAGLVIQSSCRTDEITTREATRPMAIPMFSFENISCAHESRY